MPRLPEITNRDQLPEDARPIMDEMIKTRGKVLTSYATMFHAPEVVARVLHLGTYLRFESSLPKQMIELLALTTSTELENAYERTIHATEAAKLGIGVSVIEAILAKAELPPGPLDINLPVQCAREMTRTHALSDATFEAAQHILGNRGVVDMVGTVGFYTMLACIHNALQVLPPNVR